MRPSHASHIWSDPNSIYLEIPSPVGPLTHSLSFPNTEAGLRLCLQVLNARTARSTIGTRGAPTKQQVEKNLEEMADAFLKNGGKVVRKKKDKFTEGQRQTARDVLREIGLI